MLDSDVTDFEDLPEVDILGNSFDKFERDVQMVTLSILTLSFGTYLCPKYMFNKLTDDSIAFAVLGVASVFDASVKLAACARSFHKIYMDYREHRTLVEKAPSLSPKDKSRLDKLSKKCILLDGAITFFQKLFSSIGSIAPTITTGRSIFTGDASWNAICFQTTGVCFALVGTLDFGKKMLKCCAGDASCGEVAVGIFSMLLNFINCAALGESLWTNFDTGSDLPINIGYLVITIILLSTMAHMLVPKLTKLEENAVDCLSSKVSNCALSLFGRSDRHGESEEDELDELPINGMSSGRSSDDDSASSLPKILSA